MVKSMSNITTHLHFSYTKKSVDPNYDCLIFYYYSTELYGILPQSPEKVFIFTHHISTLHVFSLLLDNLLHGITNELYSKY